MVSLSDYVKSGMRLKKAFLLAFILVFPFFLYAGAVTVTIKAGDTLYKISRKFKVPVNDLIMFNNIKNPSSLRIGSILKIPSVYTVKKGDTLYGISKNFKISVSTLCTLNKIDLTHVLKIGETLQVPYLEPVSSPAAAKQEDQKSSQKVSRSDDNLLWPHKGKRIAIKGKLTGEEILGKEGDIIISVSSGKVVWVAPYRGYGKLVMIETKDKLIFAYGGNNKTLVKVGDEVKPGTKIGTMGIDPIGKNAKAFFFVYKGGKPVDPRKAPRR